MKSKRYIYHWQVMLALSIFSMMYVFVFHSLIALAHAQDSCRFGSVTPKSGTVPNLRRSPIISPDTLFTPRRVLTGRECILRQQGVWFELATGEFVHGDNVIFSLPVATFTPLPSPTRINTPFPTPVELIVFAKVIIEYGLNESVDLGIFPWRANQPISCRVIRVDNFPQPTPTPLRP